MPGSLPDLADRCHPYLGRSCGDPGLRRIASWWQRLALDGSLLATGTQGDVLAGEREQQLGPSKIRG